MLGASSYLAANSGLSSTTMQSQPLRTRIAAFNQTSFAAFPPAGSLPGKLASTRQTRNISASVVEVDAPTAQPTTQPEIHSDLSGDVFSEADWDSFVKAYTSQFKEHAMFLDSSSVEGTIPEELTGTLLRNGPALYEIGGKKIPQPFDGDGMAVAFSFPGGGRPPFVANRFIRTEDFLAEQEAGKMLFRGAFSVGNPSGGFFFNPFDISVKRVANTGILNWAGRILALYERDLPYHLSAPDLRTVGRTDCGGAIDGPYFAAHHRTIHEADGSKRLVGFYAEEAGANHKATIWEFDESGNQLHKTNYELPDATFAFLHDFIVTENHYIFLENPITMDLPKLLTKYMFGKACIAECLKYDTAKSTKVHLIPRPGVKSGAPAVAVAPRVYKTPSPFFSFHHVNAFEAPDGKIVVDTVAMPEGMDFSANLEIGSGYYKTDVGRGTLTRLVITPWTDNVEQINLMHRACEFPSIAPAVAARPHTHAYLVAARMDSPSQWGAPQVVAKVSVSPEVGVTRTAGPTGSDVEQTIYNPGPGRWCGEPLFVPRPGSKIEDEGWVLVLVFDANVQANELVILNAQDMGVQATVKLPFFLPAGLHGSWTGEYLGAPVDVPYEAKMYDIRNGATKYE